MFSKDPTFVKMIWENYDVHGEWSRRIALAWPAIIGGKKCLDDKNVMKGFRNDIKSSWTFALFFGAAFDSVVSYFKIIPREILKPLYEEFWQTFSGVLDWQKILKAEYAEKGYVTFLTGHRRRAPISENQLINAPVQGVACYIVMKAMEKLTRHPDLDLCPIMQVHDDLTLIIPENGLEDKVAKAIDLMFLAGREFTFINVPLTLDLSIGKNWAHMEEIGTFNSYDWLRYPDKPMEYQ